MKQLWKIIPILLATTLLFTGCFEQDGKINPEEINYLQLEAPQKGDDIAIFDTSMGEIKVLLYTNEVPEIVKHFKDLVETGFYNERNVFQIDPSYKVAAFGSEDKLGDVGKTVEKKPKETTYSQNLWPFSGSLCAITYQTGFLVKKPHFDSRSFFMGDVALSEEDAKKMTENAFPAMMKNTFAEMGGIPAYARYHSVFGKVISGMNVVNEMTQVAYEEVDLSPKDKKDKEKEEATTLIVKRPKNEIVIHKVTLSTYDPADFEKIDNCLTAEELSALKEKSRVEQEEMDAASTASAVGSSGDQQSDSQKAEDSSGESSVSTKD